MKQLTIDFERNWILAHRDDDVLPIDFLKGALTGLKDVEIKSSSFTSVTFIYNEQNVECGDMEGLIMRLFETKYPNDKISEQVTFESVDLVEEKAKDGALAGDKSENTDSAAEQFKELLGELGVGGGKKEEKKEKASVSADVKTRAIDKIEGLVGAAEFKALTKEIVGISEEIKRTKTLEVFTNQCYLFSIGEGCGLTTYLGLLSGLISELGLCKMSTGSVREVSLGGYRESAEPFYEANRAVESGNTNNVKVVCVDISEWMDRTDNFYFRQFLRNIEKHADEHILVFRVPFVDKDVLSRIKYSLSDLLSVKTVSFPPLNHDEIKSCAEAELKRYDFTITSGAWKCFFDRISEEKSDGKFYGVNTIKKVVRELVYQKHITNSQKAEKSTQITVNDTKALCDDVSGSNLSGVEQLNKLVGVDSIKKRVEEIIAQIEVSVKSGSAERPCIHMRFVGNPGTGKTTIARIIGKILREKGILRVGAFFEHSGRDFCGRYVGETAPKTSSMCRDAYGSVLFIDEAYSLYRGNAGSNDYGREAIDTLIAEMENHRNDFVVIMAGYSEDMDKLMEGNLGLASRMPYTIEFPNYTREQLAGIFVAMVKDKFKYDEGLVEAAQNFFINLPDGVVSSKGFANARYVRNLFERTWAKAAMRCQLCGKTDIVLTSDDFEHASADKEFATNVPKKTRIGF